MKDLFLKQGYLKVQKLINAYEVKQLQKLYNNLLNDEAKTAGLRSDLAGGDSNTERITQIMRPSMIEPKLLQTNTYELVTTIVKDLLGPDMELDFDMLINKAPHTDTPTPWHQDAAYWIKMPDKRSVSCWIALDNVYEANGCMWFIPKGNDQILPHKPSAKGGALCCETNVDNAECIPLDEGGCTFHDGFTLHYSKGNSTNTQRRALILNFRPKDMIALEREQGVDHTGERKVRNK